MLTEQPNGMTWQEYDKIQCLMDDKWCLVNTNLLEKIIQTKERFIKVLEERCEKIRGTLYTKSEHYQTNIKPFADLQGQLLVIENMIENEELDEETKQQLGDNLWKCRNEKSLQVCEIQKIQSELQRRKIYVELGVLNKNF